MRASLRARLTGLAVLVMVAVTVLPANATAARPGADGSPRMQPAAAVGVSLGAPGRTGAAELSFVVEPRGCTRPGGCCEIAPSLDRPGGAHPQPQGGCSGPPLTIYCRLDVSTPEYIAAGVESLAEVKCDHEVVRISMVLDLYRETPPGRLVDRDVKQELFPTDRTDPPAYVEDPDGCKSGIYFAKAVADIRMPPGYLPPNPHPPLVEQTPSVIITC
jgi:hypothetical protein